MRVLTASHGEEIIGLSVHAANLTQPTPGLHTRIAHPLAAALGERFLGKRQIMAHYPGELTSGDPESIAAAENMTWLGSAAGSDSEVVVDLHSNSHPGYGFAEVGARALKASLGAAVALGQTCVVTRLDTFYTAVPNAVLLETPVSSSEESARLGRLLHGRLAEIALAPIKLLEERYEAAAAKLAFRTMYQLAVSPAAESIGESSIPIHEPDVLAYFEGLSWQPPKSELKLPTEMRTAIGLPEGPRVYMGLMAYDNGSPILPGAGLSQGKPRREFYGTLMLEASPPVDDGKWVRFEAS